MSFEYYCTWWIRNKHNLEKLTGQDEAFRKIPQGVQERQLANKLVGGMYAKYCMLVKELDGCLDQLAQPQKTVTIRKLVESAVFRLKELYNELRWIDFSEYHYIDGTLVELKLIPHDIEILHPYISYPRPYEIQEMYEKFKKGERIYTGTTPVAPEEVVPTVDDAAAANVTTVDQAVAEKPPTPPPPPPPEADDKKTNISKKKKARKQPKTFFIDKKEELTPEQLAVKKREEQIQDAIKLIQRHERARQSRIFHYEMDRAYVLNKKEMMAHTTSTSKVIQNKTSSNIESSSTSSHNYREKAAITIQRYYRGHFARKYLKKREEQRRILIGMNEKSFRTRKEFEVEEAYVEARRNLRELRIHQYIQAHCNEKERLLRVVAPGLAEDISDEIREWFYQWYVRARNFDKYPPEEKGGTILVVRGETLTPEEWIDEVERKRREKVKAGGSKDDKAKKKAEKAKKRAAEKAAKKAKMQALKQAKKEKAKRRRDVTTFQMEFDEPQGAKLYAEGEDEHAKIWDFRDEHLNPEETHYMDLITDQRAYEVQLEVRKKVDEMMRIELDLLNAALLRDKNKKPKKPKKPKKKKKKGKRGKKQPKDITAHRTVEDIFQELVDNGIVHLYPKTRLDQFFGDMSYKNYELRYNEYLNPPPCLGDVRQAITMNCIIPLGLEDCKDRIRSTIIVGPPQSGKKILANAIFTATRCVLFDISPEVLAGKYPGKAGMNMFLHLVMKMARILQPSILYIDDAVKPFYKKVPREEAQFEPKRLGKVLQKKIVKTIKPPDRIMLLSTTNRPWVASNKMTKCFDKAVLIPRSDYGSVYLYWRELLMPYHGVDRDIDLSCLAKLTVNYPLGVIENVTRAIMTPRRIVQLNRVPLTPQELFEPFLKIEPVTDKAWKKYQKWYDRTTFGKLGKKFAKVQTLKREEAVQKREAEDRKRKAKNK